jgi:ABC-2 type transport system permease protein
MKRYLRLYLYFLQFSFSRAMEFRLDFFFRIAMDTIYYAVNIALFKVIFLHTPSLGGWNHEAVMLFVGSFLLVDAINMTVFSTNLWWLPYYVNKGELDYYLIRPVSPLFFLSLREFSANSFVNLLMALGFFIYSVSQFSGAILGLKLVAFLFLLLNGVILHFCLQLLTTLPVFWTQSPRGYTDLFYAVSLSMERPDKIFRGWMRMLFTTILPFTLIASFPARFFIEGLSGKEFLLLAFVSMIFWASVYFVWNRALKVYGSASS